MFFFPVTLRLYVFFFIIIICNLFPISNICKRMNTGVIDFQFGFFSHSVLLLLFLLRFRKQIILYNINEYPRITWGDNSNKKKLYDCIHKMMEIFSNHQTFYFYFLLVPQSNNARLQFSRENFYFFYR